ncbi:hypothetical protein DFJ74DRAFT_410801 [Hyaloraphidium curvatum]|nr:hypothetical protein DFJ74DRAFT_410801 [Hyaloraphidium curvatum]
MDLAGRDEAGHLPRSRLVAARPREFQLCNGQLACLPSCATSRDLMLENQRSEIGGLSYWLRISAPASATATASSSHGTAPKSAMDAAFLTADVLGKVSEVLVGAGKLATVAALSSASRELRRLLLPVLFRRLAVGPRVPVSTWRSVLDAFGGKELPVVSLRIDVPLPPGSIAEAIAGERRHLQAWHAVIRDLLASCASLKDLEIVMPPETTDHLSVKQIMTAPPELVDAMADPSGVFHFPSRDEVKDIREALANMGARPAFELALPRGLDRFSFSCIAADDAVNVFRAVAGSTGIGEWGYSGPVLDLDLYGGLSAFRPAVSSLTSASFAGRPFNEYDPRRSASEMLDTIEASPRLRKLAVDHVFLGTASLASPRFSFTLKQLDELRSLSVCAIGIPQGVALWPGSLLRCLEGFEIAFGTDNDETQDGLELLASLRLSPNFELVVEDSVMTGHVLRRTVSSSALRNLKVMVSMQGLPGRLALLVRGPLPRDLRRLTIDVLAMADIYQDFATEVLRVVDRVAFALVSRGSLPEGLSVLLDIRSIVRSELEHLVDKVALEWDPSRGVFRRLAWEGAGDRTPLPIEVGTGFCASCGKQLVGTRFVCSGCRSERYCGGQCQKKAWVAGGHKRFCAAIRSGHGVLSD